MSYFHSLMKHASATLLAAALGVAGTQIAAASAVVSLNSLTFNALETTGSPLDQLNGVAVEAVAMSQENADISPGDEE
jgi:hypothetical protein